VHASGEFGDDRLLGAGHVDVELDAASTDQKVRCVRSFTEMVAREKRVSATAIQTVGVKGHDGIAVVRVKRLIGWMHRMADSPSLDAWNNFVMLSEPSRHEIGSSKWSAAIAKRYMGGANNGGINSFLTSSWELDASKVLAALVSIGALQAAQQLDRVLRGLGVPVPSLCQDARFRLLERHWSDALDEYDALSSDADEDLMRVLKRHVLEHEAFYLALA